MIAADCAQCIAYQHRSELGFRAGIVLLGRRRGRLEPPLVPNQQAQNLPHDLREPHSRVAV